MRQRKTDRLSDPPPDDSRAVDRGVLAAMGCAVIVVLIGGTVGGISLMRRFAVDDPVAGVSAVDPAEVDLPEIVEPIGPDPLAAMRPRYRPGPYVQTVGLLPSGMSQTQQLPGAGGRTIDNPWIVVGADLRVGAAPTSANGPGLTLTGNLALPVSVIPGAPSQIPIRAVPGPGGQGDVQGLLLEFVGYPGHFFLPAAVETELGRIQIAGVEEAQVEFGIDAPVLPGGIPAPSDKEMEASVRIASVDMQGRMSPWVTRQITVVPLGTGDVEVALSMTESTDLDLYVTDPNGVVVYYGNTTGGSGGHLDLDANAGCGSNVGVNNEHIFWPQGAAPAGTYEVRVAHFSNCNNRAVDYRITVRNCGESAVFSGSFDASSGDSRTCTSNPGTQRGWCQQVVSFDVTPCTP